MQRKYESFGEFWPHYVREHSHETTRTLHFVGTTAAMACVVKALATGKLRWLALALAAGYGPAWYSHFAIEKNRPATFEHPLLSFQADLVMWGKTIAGTIDADVERYKRVNGPIPITIDVEVAKN